MILTDSHSVRGLVAALLLVGSAAADDVVYTVVDGAGVPDRLTTTAPSPDRGGVIYLDPERGRCGACHRISALPDRGWSPALAGPDLDGVAERLTEAEIRLVIVNPRLRDPEARMPAYFEVSAELAAADPAARQPALTGREIEDVIAFLLAMSAD